jgi:hypothetical protein
MPPGPLTWNTLLSYSWLQLEYYYAGVQLHIFLSFVEVLGDFSHTVLADVEPVLERLMTSHLFMLSWSATRFTLLAPVKLRFCLGVSS